MMKKITVLKGYKGTLTACLLLVATTVTHASPGGDTDDKRGNQGKHRHKHSVVNSSVNSSVTDLERRIAELERLLNDVKQQQADIARQEQAQKEELEAMAMKKSSGFSISPSGSKLSFYGTIRPALTYSDSKFTDIHGFNYEVVNPVNPNSSVEVTDFFTRIGIYGETNVGAGITAFVRSEMEIAIGAGYEFDPRLAFAGVKGAFGRLAIGRQSHPHYNTIVEVTDLFNHRSSPFGYDRQGPFRSNDLVTYTNSVPTDLGTLKLDTGLQFGRSGVDSRGDSADSGHGGADAGSVGVAFSNDRLYLGVSYLKRQRDDGNSRNYSGIGAGVNLTDKLYLGATVQDIRQERDLGGDDNGHSIDVSGSYDLGSGLKVIAGYFDVDAAGRDGDCPVSGSDGGDDCSYTDGYNLTLQKQVSDNFRVFVEWLHFDYDNVLPIHEDSVNAISAGVRYDFSLDVL